MVWLAGSGALAWTAHRPDPPAALAAAARPAEVLADGFSGSGACRACHPGEYASWHRSYHRTMTQPATPQTVRGDFDARQLQAGERSYRLERSGDAFLVNGERVLMTTGSHHMQAYWVAAGTGNAVELVQLVYLFDEGRWIPRRDAFLQPPGAPPRDDLWNANCIECHATHGRPRLREQPDTHVNELGIACEACHGPAGAHARFHGSPLRRYAAHYDERPGDATIVNPRRLSARRASHVCARCHAITAFPTAELEQAYLYGDGDRFRPGDDLDETGHVLRGPDDPLGPTDPDPALQFYRRDNMFWPDGPSRGSGREFNAMAHSACYGDGESPDNVSCVSCHEMHKKDDDPRTLDQWADDQLQRGMDGDAACLQCHDRALALATHTHHEPASSGSRCTNCHMPFTTYGLLKAIRTHHIASPDVAVDLATGRPNACNLCHLDRSLGWTAEHLEKWYETPVPPLSAAQRQVAASIPWLLAGDARQRALLAWHAGWAPAQQASGSDWLAPFVAPLLADPYSAVRILASRSLRTLPGFEEFEVDYLAPPERLEAGAQQVWRIWGARGTQRREPGLLIGSAGLNGAALGALLRQRDDRPVGVVE